MVKTEVIGRRLGLLSEYLARLDELKLDSNLISDSIRYAAAERFLQLAIEACFDIGEHWIVDNELGTPDSYREIPQILFEKEKIDQNVAESWMTMAGFRNVLVHDYVKIDRARIVYFLNNNLQELYKLQSIFSGLI